MCSAADLDWNRSFKEVVRCRICTLPVHQKGEGFTQTVERRREFESVVVQAVSIVQAVHIKRGSVPCVVSFLLFNVVDGGGEVN